MSPDVGSASALVPDPCLPLLVGAANQRSRMCARLLPVPSAKATGVPVRPACRKSQSPVEFGMRPAIGLSGTLTAHCTERAAFCTIRVNTTRGPLPGSASAIRRLTDRPRSSGREGPRRIPPAAAQAAASDAAGRHGHRYLEIDSPKVASRPVVQPPISNGGRSLDCGKTSAWSKGLLMSK